MSLSNTSYCVIVMVLVLLNGRRFALSHKDMATLATLKRRIVMAKRHLWASSVERNSGLDYPRIDRCWSITQPCSVATDLNRKA